MIKYLYIILIFALFSSCHPVLMIYGTRNLKEISTKKITKLSRRLDMLPADGFLLDSNYYSYLFSFDKSRQDSTLTENKELKQQIKNHYQPLQALYFNKNGKLVSYQINCYAGGFPNITWDRFGTLTTFPPKLQTPIDTLISEPTLVSFLKPLPDSEEIISGKHDYIVYLFWSRFMGRQNRRFIRFMQENAKLAKEKNIRLIYINIDNAFKTTDIL